MDKIKKYLPFAAFGLIGIVCIMAFFPAIQHNRSGEDWNWFKISIIHEEYAFSFMNTLTYVLVLGGAALLVLSYINPDNKLFLYGAIGCLLLAGIFFFCAIAFLNLEEYPSKIHKMIRESLSLGAGAIIAGICSILAAICAAAPTVLNMLDIK